MQEDQYKRIYDCVVNGKATEALKIGEDMRAAGISVQDVGKVLIDAMNLVGHRYREREIALPQLILATHCFKKILVPYVADARGNSGVVVIGTVKNDIHDIGKNIVATFLEVRGFKVYDLGMELVDADPQTEWPVVLTEVWSLEGTATAPSVTKTPVL